jgi:tetratricopeptide (TPR) repeat protein
MPYFGSTTLAHVLLGLQGRAALPDSGKFLADLLRERRSSLAVGDTLPPHSTLDPEGRTLPEVSPPEVPAVPAPAAGRSTALLERLQALSYVEAVLWLAARLADGLGHAHERGILHRDLKPANVLLTDEGQPMLLDFNIAEDTKRRSGAAAARMGGTLPYMAPEQLIALQGGDDKVDARSDLFSVGIILCELLTGRSPYPAQPDHEAGGLYAMIEERRQPPPGLRRWNPAVSPAVESIVRHCLEPAMGERYQSARELLDDLERQLSHRTLRHAPEPSLRERAGKWVRRHPRLASSTSVGLVAAALLVGLGLLFAVRGYQLARWEERQAALDAHQQFRNEMEPAHYLLYTRLADPDQLAAGRERALQALERYQVLDNPAWRDLPEVRNLPDDDRQQLCDDVGELLLLLARATAWQRPAGATAAEPEEPLRSALRMNALAEAYSPRAAGSQVLWRQRSELTAALGQEAEAQRLRERAAALPLRTARDYYWSAGDHIRAGRFREALPLLRRATELEPKNYWAHFVLGTCYDRLGNDVRAEACYSTCVSIRPDLHWPYFNRGLAHLRQRNHDQAFADFDKVVELKPDLTDAYVNRALAREGLKEYDAAIRDLTDALERGASQTRLYFNRARLREKVGDAEGARRDFEEGMRLEPGDEKSWNSRGVARLGRDPRAALDDFEQALRLNPLSRPALENKAHVLAEKLGRTEEAVRVLDQLVALFPEAAAPRRGRGVLHARLGRRDAALKDAEESLRYDTSPPQLYQVACVYALTSRLQPEDRPRAFQLLSSALRRGFGHTMIETDTDLDPLRKQPEFVRLVEAARALRAAETPAVKK